MGDMMEMESIHEQATRLGRIGAWAPGGYVNKCSCGRHFEGDKRAHQCLPCAVTAVVDYAERRGVSQAADIAGAFEFIKDLEVELMFRGHGEDYVRVTLPRHQWVRLCDALSDASKD